MKRAALLTAGLLAVVALGGCRAHAQPVVAKLEVVKASKQTPSQHERIEQKLDQVLEILKGKPPVVDPPKPVEPTTPAGPNPFIAWREQGLTLVDISMWRLGRALTDAELEQAYAAGYARRDAAPGGGGWPGGIDPKGFDLGQGGVVLKHTVAANQPLTLTFTVLPGRAPVELWVMTISGSYFNVVTDTGPGFTDRRSNVIGSFHKAIEGMVLPPGTYQYTFSIDVGGQVGIQFNQ